MVDAGVKAPLNATELAAFQAVVYRGVMSYSGHETRVENHGLDAAIEQLYMLRIWPKMNETCSSCRYVYIVKRKRPFSHVQMLKIQHLPRQARDKHR